MDSILGDRAKLLVLKTQREICDDLAQLPHECIDPGTTAMSAVVRLARAELFAQDFVLGDELGKGGFARVFRARERCSGREVAVKEIPKQLIVERKLTAKVVNEVKIHWQLHHTHVVDLLNFFEDEEKIYLVLELCEKGDLYKYIHRNGPMDEQAARGIILQLLHGLQYLHSHGIVHRDLKLANLLLTEDDVLKICDFGLAVRLQTPDEEHFTLCGTPNYIAPEIAAQEAHSMPADLWAVGVVFYTLIVGRPPFQGAQIRETLAKVAQGEYKEPEHASPLAKDFLRKLLRQDPDQRADVNTILRHPFLEEPAPSPPQHPSDVSNGSNERFIQEGPQGLSAMLQSNPSLLDSLRTPPILDFSAFTDRQPSNLASAASAIAGASGGRPPTPVSRDASKSPLTTRRDSTPKRCPQSPASIAASPGGKFGSFVSGLVAQMNASSVLTEQRPYRVATAPTPARVQSAAPASPAPAPVRATATTKRPLRPLNTARLPAMVHCHSSGGSVFAISDTGDVILCLVAKKWKVWISARQQYTVCAARLDDTMLQEAAQLRAQWPSRGRAADGSHTPQNSWTLAAAICPKLLAAPMVTAATARSQPHIKSYRLSQGLPASIEGVYRYMSKMITTLRARVPKIVMYLHTQSGSEKTADCKVICKCLLMENAPLPDFCVRWCDGTRLRYSLATGALRLESPGLATVYYKASDSGSGGDLGSTWMEHCPPQVASYMLVAQQTMHRCMQLSHEFDTRANSNLSCSLPIVVHDEIHKSGDVEALLRRHKQSSPGVSDMSESVRTETLDEMHRIAD